MEMNRLEQKVQIESTADGSHTLFVPSLNEHYHSVNGAKQESEHIYINAGLLHSSKENLNVLEIGFGTGLNAYLTLLIAEQTTKHIDYTSLELYPLPMDVVKQLNYVTNRDPEHRDMFIQLHSSEWGYKNEITESFSLTKIKDDFSLLNLPVNLDISFDVIYFDAFAPEKQPEMWSQEIFDFLYSKTNMGGILTTYCAKGVVRRMLQEAGYFIERLPGPVGKREILRATKL
ncbi:tRNA U34 5-methylaminomethyl-2-thiouridine-forming methyltransferase MnmC [Dysgonomonas alginatilytica]|uniref:tRNA U34 5-methylaminomethyl-2-thiouridine-forming methyltransferase MnmC n=1 Tax=Dysgonomonas alginatilytica TaxID=1605892 RepID=A0A2V3PRM9_9BACT|nr:tRNA (5-methylaminomethyl-2-thiouridine)(34)-methyltransferase MnmD [Dysgonomonas alginatilytica]PXV60278.1 tRNA U34 5-methylaminomethyl-2-thiouridine-forming methyltransferase MnmC [Dysgonomonas alginatilytica]